MSSALAAGCPTCHAAPGQPCDWAGAGNIPAHPARVTSALTGSPEIHRYNNLIVSELGKLGQAALRKTDLTGVFNAALARYQAGETA